jgi:hypothetical protein
MSLLQTVQVMECSIFGRGGESSGCDRNTVPRTDGTALVMQFGILNESVVWLGASDISWPNFEMGLTA